MVGVGVPEFLVEQVHHAALAAMTVAVAVAVAVDTDAVAAVAAAAQMRMQRLRQQERRDRVHLQVGGQAGGLEILDAVVLETRGVVDHGVAAAHAFDHCGQQCAAGRLVGEVGCENFSPGTEQKRLRARLCGLCARLVRVQGEVEAVRRQLERDGPPDAARRTGDQHHGAGTRLHA